jgi:hypothetical protein
VIDHEPVSRPPKGRSASRRRSAGIALRTPTGRGWLPGLGGKAGSYLLTDGGPAWSFLRNGLRPQPAERAAPGNAGTAARGRSAHGGPHAQWRGGRHLRDLRAAPDAESALEAFRCKHHVRRPYQPFQCAVDVPLASSPAACDLQCGSAGVLFQPRPSRSAVEATCVNGAGSAALIAASSRLRWRAMAACRSAGSVASSSSSIA